MKKQILQIISFVVCIASLFFSCSKESPIEPEPTFSQKLQKALDDSMELNGGFGISAAVLMPGQNVWLGTSGISHDDVPISPNMMFSIASVTKMFTAACILQLAEEGKLSLDDSLSQWLPEFPNINRTITIRQLLNHTSGVFDYYWHPDFEDSFRSDLTRRWTPEETLSMVLEPYFPPGTDFRYSNTGYILLGMIIRAATGNKVSTEFRKRFLDPLELTQTFFYVEETISGEMAHGWYDFDGDGFIDDMTTYPLTSYYSIEWTAGAMVSTPKDMVQWASALFEGELLSKTSLDQMLMFDPFSGEGRASNEYGLGVRRFNPTIAHGEECIGHSGEVIGYRNIIAYLTGKRVSVSVMINNMRAESLWGTVEALITVVLDNID